jgi:hypothetical protein
MIIVIKECPYCETVRFAVAYDTAKSALVLNPGGPPSPCPHLVLSAISGSSAGEAEARTAPEKVHCRVEIRTGGLDSLPNDPEQFAKNMRRRNERLIAAFGEAPPAICPECETIVKQAGEQTIVATIAFCRDRDAFEKWFNERQSSDTRPDDA